MMFMTASAFLRMQEQLNIMPSVTFKTVWCAIRGGSKNTNEQQADNNTNKTNVAYRPVT